MKMLNQNMMSNRNNLLRDWKQRENTLFLPLAKNWTLCLCTKWTPSPFYFYFILFYLYFSSFLFCIWFWYKALLISSGWIRTCLRLPECWNYIHVPLFSVKTFYVIHSILIQGKTQICYSSSYKDKWICSSLC